MLSRRMTAAVALVTLATAPVVAQNPRTLTAPFESYLELLRQQAGIPGLSAAIVHEGDIVWEYVSPFMGADRFGDPSNEVFRAYRYAEDSPQIGGRLGRVER